MQSEITLDRREVYKQEVYKVILDCMCSCTHIVEACISLGFFVALLDEKFFCNQYLVWHDKKVSTLLSQSLP